MIKQQTRKKLQICKGDILKFQGPAKDYSPKEEKALIQMPSEDTNGLDNKN